MYCIKIIFFALIFFCINPFSTNCFAAQVSIDEEAVKNCINEAGGVSILMKEEAQTQKAKGEQIVECYKKKAAKASGLKSGQDISCLNICLVFGGVVNFVLNSICQNDCKAKFPPDTITKFVKDIVVPLCQKECY